MIPFGDVPAELYRWFLLTYGVSADGRIAVEAIKQLTVLQTAWYDIPTAAFNTLGAEAKAETNRARPDWLDRKETAEANCQPFNEPPTESRS